MKKLLTTWKIAVTTEVIAPSFYHYKGKINSNKLIYWQVINHTIEIPN